MKKTTERNIDLLGKEKIIDLNDPFYTNQLITYIGNKRSLLPFLNYGFEEVRRKLGNRKLTILDGFSGSGSVSRLLKSYSIKLYSNDLENYSYITNKCYLSNASEINQTDIKETIDALNGQKSILSTGFLTDNYSPKDDSNIKEGERVFYTHRNGMILDTFKKWIYENIPEKYRHFYLAPLIFQASVHTNTSGIFKGFHKKDGIGHFGGAGENALSRIMKEISLPYPIFSKDECEVEIHNKDINLLIQQLPEMDLVYYDPPYNQHPYGSNYFMLNILASSDLSVPIQNGVSGIAENWNRSAYNKKQLAIDSMDDLIKNTKSKYILISYNNEGIIPFDIFKAILTKYGNVDLLQQDYNTYRGCKNLKNRNIKVREFLWIVKKHTL